MPTIKYVSHAQEGEHPDKVFDHRHDAVAFASQQASDGVELVLVYEVALPDDVPEAKRVRAAVADVRAGNGQLMDSRAHGLSEVEDIKWMDRKLAQWIKRDPEGALRALREFRAQKNA